MAPGSQKKPFSPRRRDGLLRHAMNVHSQCGEDGILAFLFSKCFPPTSRRFLLDVGSWDGQHLSNSRNLLSRGPEIGCGEWGGVLIEAERGRAEECVRCTPLSSRHTSPRVITHKNSTARAGKLYADNSFVESVEATVGLRASHKDLASILKNKKSCTPADFRRQAVDFLSIDIDGLDYWVWEEAEEELLQAAVVCIEYNPTIPLHVRFVNPKDESKRQGSSILSLCE